MFYYIFTAPFLIHARVYFILPATQLGGFYTNQGFPGTWLYPGDINVTRPWRWSIYLYFFTNNINGALSRSVCLSIGSVFWLVSVLHVISGCVLNSKINGVTFNFNDKVCPQTVISSWGRKARKDFGGGECIEQETIINRNRFNCYTILTALQHMWLFHFFTMEQIIM